MEVLVPQVKCSKLARSVGVMILFVCAGCAIPERNENTTQVLVVGTVHQQHARNPNYSYRHIAQILSTYDPDLICVEIRPQDFRRRPYLKEMMLATAWGVTHGKVVCAIDHWNESDSTRQVRERLREQPEYLRKQQQLDSLQAASLVIQSFEEEYGEDFWDSEMGYQFYNGPEYNEYISEAYRLSMEVYGDNPMNLYYQTRNARMLELIRGAMRDNAAARLVVLTGAEHKHFFDRALQRAGDVSLVQLADILPLQDEVLDSVTRSFLEEANDLPYYVEGYPEDLNEYYWGKFTGLVHGPGMDRDPGIIPEENVRVAGKLLERWRASSSESPRLLFELGWHAFLSEDYELAVQNFGKLARQVDEGSVTSLFLRVFTYRNLGFCHDMLGERDAAIRAYSRAEELMQGTDMEARKDRILVNYLSLPYRRAGQDGP
jgi:tetratricopeptide (TPR) repeat protein